MHNPRRFLFVSALVAMLAGFASAAPTKISCTGAAAPTTIVRSEGITELVGTITIATTCTIDPETAGPADSAAPFVIQFFTSGGIPVKSYVDGTDPSKSEATITITQPGGTNNGTYPGSVSGNSITFGTSDAPVEFPTNGSAFSITVSGLRVDASQIETGPPMDVTVLAASLNGALASSAIFAGSSPLLQISNVAIALSSLHVTDDLTVSRLYDGGAHKLILQSCTIDTGFDLAKIEADNADHRLLQMVFTSITSNAFVQTVTDSYTDANPGALATRLTFSITNVPAGVTLYVPTLPVKADNGPSQATLILGYDPDFSGGYPFSAIRPTDKYVQLTPDANGTVTAVYQLSGYAAAVGTPVPINVYAKIRNPNAPAAPVAVSGGYAPLYTYAGIPRFLAGGAVSTNTVQYSCCTSPPPPQPVCSVTIPPTTLTPASSGGAFSIQVYASDSSCSWRVTGLPAWVQASTSLGSGNASILFTVAANTGVARSATIHVGDSDAQISQAGPAASCSYSLGGNGQGVPAAGGSGSISITAVEGCAWTASSAPALGYLHQPNLG